MPATRKKSVSDSFQADPPSASEKNALPAKKVAKTPVGKTRSQHASKPLPENRGAAHASDISQGKICSDKAVSQKGRSKKAYAESAHTESAHTEGVSTEGATTEGVSTEGVSTEGASTEGAHTESALLKDESFARPAFVKRKHFVQGGKDNDHDAVCSSARSGNASAFRSGKICVAGISAASGSKTPRACSECKNSEQANLKDPKNIEVKETGTKGAGLKDVGLEVADLKGAGLKDVGLEVADLKGTGLKDVGLDLSAPSLVSTLVVLGGQHEPDRVKSVQTGSVLFDQVQPASGTCLQTSTAKKDGTGTIKRTRRTVNSGSAATDSEPRKQKPFAGSVVCAEVVGTINHGIKPGAAEKALLISLSPSTSTRLYICRKQCFSGDRLWGVGEIRKSTELLSHNLWRELIPPTTLRQ